MLVISGNVANIFGADNPTSGRKISPEDGENILEFVKKLENFTNLEVTPCNNFYKFVCGKYPALDKGRNETSTHGIFLKFLKSRKSDNLTHGSVKALNFYNSCRKNQSITDIQKSMLYKESGGFPALSDDYKPVSWPKVFAIFHNYGVDLFIKLKISVQNNKRTFVMEPNFKYKHTIETINNRSIKLLKKLNVSDNKIEQISTEITELEKKRRNLIRSREKPSKRMNLTYEKFLEKYPEINWNDYFPRILGKNPKPNDQIQLLHEHNLQSILQLLTTTPENTISNYYWMLFIQETNRGNCLTLSRKYFSTLYQAIIGQPRFKKSSFLKLLDNIKKLYNEQIASSLWSDEISRENSNLYWNKFKHFYEQQLGKVDVVYGNLEISENDFYENLRNGEIFINTQTINYTSSLVDEFFTGKLNRSIIEDGVNLVLNYGIIATEIAKNVIRGGDGIVSWRSTESNEKFNKFSECLGGSQAESMLLEKLAVKISYSLMEGWLKDNAKFVEEFKGLVGKKAPSLDDPAKIFFVTNSMYNCEKGEQFINDFVKNFDGFDMVFGCPISKDVTCEV